MTNATPSAHSDLVGGSSAARRLNCPPSYLLERQVPESLDEGSVYAQEGTALHEIMAMVLERGVEPTELLPFTFTAPPEKGGWTFTVDEELWNDKGETALTMFDTLCLTKEAQLDEPMEFLVETKVAFPGIAGAFGTSDVIAKCGDEILIFDWKFGQGIVDARENSQMMFYAAAALDTVPEFFESVGLSDNTKITMVIIQPAAGQPSVWETTVATLDEFAAALRSSVKLALSGGGEARAGEWCDFARCQVICPVRAQATKDLSDKLTRLHEVQSKPDTPPVDLEAAVSEVLSFAEIVKPMLAAAEALALGLMTAGRVVPGFVLKPKRAGARRWVDDDQAIEYLTQYVGDGAVKTAPLSPAQAEKALKAAGVGIPDHLVEVPESSGFNVVRAADHHLPVSELVEAGARIARRLA